VLLSLADNFQIFPVTRRAVRDVLPHGLLEEAVVISTPGRLFQPFAARAANPLRVWICSEGFFLYVLHAFEKLFVHWASFVIWFAARRALT